MNQYRRQLRGLPGACDQLLAKPADLEACDVAAKERDVGGIDYGAPATHCVLPSATIYAIQTPIVDPRARAPFLGAVPVRFAVAEPESRYHVPLLFTP